MGDHILAARFIRDAIAHLESIEFDLYCVRPALARWLLAGIPNCRLIVDRKADLKILRREYFAALNVQTFVNVRYANARRLQASGAPRALVAMLERVRAHCKPLALMIDLHPAIDGQLGHYTVMEGGRRHNYLHKMAGLNYGGDSLSLEFDESAIQRHGLSKVRYFTISNGYDEEATIPEGRRMTKVYPHFEEVVRLVHQHHPDVRFVQIGTKQTSRLIPGIDLNLIGQTSIKEAAGLIKHALLHIDNEGGLVHLAAALGTRSAVVFGPTLSEYFGYETNINIAPATCGGCWWMRSDWMSTCLKGDREPSCMYTQKPSNVAQRVVELLHRLNNEAAA